MGQEYVFCILWWGAFFLGSIPFGIFISRFNKIDIRRTGSGNIGATNVSRALGMRWGLVVAVLDVAKSAIPLFVAQQMLTNPFYIAAVAIAPVAGHIYSPWLGFRGGKGAGATLGMLLVLLGPVGFLILLCAWIASLVIFRLMSATNLVLAILVPVIFWFIFRSPATIGVGCILTIMLWIAHRENIDRLLHGKENVLTFKF